MMRLSIIAALLVAGCVDLPEIVPSPTGQVMAMFDPLGNPDAVPALPAVLPTPTNLALDRATGLLANVPDSPGIGAAEKALNAYLRTLDGFPPTATAEVKFDGKLDPKSVTADAIAVWNLTDKKKLTGLIYEYLELENTLIGSKSLVRIWNLSGWERGKEYAFYVLTGSTKGLKDARGKPLIRSALFELAIGENPLCAWNEKGSWDATKQACTEPAVGGAALGCCTFNYSALVDSSVSKKVHAKAPEGTTHEELEGLVKAAILDSVSQFEAIRRDYDRLVKAAGVNRSDVVLLWSFNTTSMNEAIFNPAGSPPQLPKPTDLIRNPATGFLAVPTSASASKAEVEFNDYLATLDGWHVGSTPALEFTGKLDPKSISSTTGTATTFPLKVYKVDKTNPAAPKLTLVPEDTVKVSWNETLQKLTLLPPKTGLEQGTTYLVVALAGTSGLKNLDSKLAAAPVRSALMHLTLLSDPLCSWDSAKNACTDSKISSFIDDPKVVQGGRTGVAKATIFEGLRQGNDLLLKALTADGTIKREEVVSAWTYTTTTLTEMIYDPTSGVVPFPNAVLMDQTTGKLNLPAGALPEALRQGLNQLDGFSTQGAAFAPYLGSIDATTAAYGTSLLALDLKVGAPIPMTFTVDETSGAILATPPKPLKEGTQYSIVIVSRLDKGKLKPKAGLADKNGNRVVPSLFMALKRNSNPLYDATTGKSLVSTLDDATAKLAESARAAHVALFEALNSLGIPREDVVSAWVYGTQTFTKGLTDLRTAALAKLPAAPKLTGALDPTLTGLPASVPAAALGGWVPAGTFKTWLAIDETKGTLLSDANSGKLKDVPFMLTVPKTAAPAAGWPVVVFQHALNQDRKNFLAVANTMASAGMATIAFDTIYHGERSWCTKDAHCDAGTCTVATGVCAGGKLKLDATTGVYEASGAHFLNTDNPFAIRDNMLQHVVDSSALLRTIEKGGDSGITGGTVKLDSTKIYLIGNNIGSNLGLVAMANEPLINRAVFNTGGAPLVEVLLVSSGTTQLISDLLKQFGVQKGTWDFLQLVNIFHTILDPGDAGNWAGTISKTDALVQLAGKDTVIPQAFGQYLADLIGVSTTNTIFANQGPAFLLKPDPAGTTAATVAAQTQAVTFLLSGAICTPNTITGACN